MKPALCIDNARIVIPGERIVQGSVLVRDGKIRSLSGQAFDDAGTQRFDANGRILTPGLIDLHTHGFQRWMYENGEADLLSIAGALPSTGTTCSVPTLVPQPGPKLMGQLEKLAGALRTVARHPGSRMPGLHLEGPFVALTGAACRPCVGDVGYLKELIAAADGQVAVMSISPEVRGIIPVIEHLRERGIAVFMTHTQASVEETEAAIAAGARHATHFYDVFPIPAEKDHGVRPAGAVEAILADPRVSVDFICDGCHVHPVAIRMAIAAKGFEGVCLISDSNIGSGLTPGVYETPWGYPVRVKDGDGARIADPAHPFANALAGSALTMNRGMQNLFRWLNLPEAQIWAIGCLNAARVAGLVSKGRMEAGADADLVLWNPDTTVARTWVGGNLVYDSSLREGVSNEHVHV